jgi:hypothetical protein
MVFDAGASLHLSNAPAFHHINAHFRRKKGIEPLTFFYTKSDPMRIFIVRILMPDHTFVQVVVGVALNGLL